MSILLKPSNTDLTRRKIRALLVHRYKPITLSKGYGVLDRLHNCRLLRHDDGTSRKMPTWAAAQKLADDANIEGRYPIQK